MTTTTVNYVQLPSSQIHRLAVQYYSDKDDVAMAIYKDFHRSNSSFTALQPPPEHRRELEGFVARLESIGKGANYLDALPSDQHVHIFGGFNTDGTADVKGGQRAMVVSESVNKYLVGSKKLTKRCSQLVGEGVWGFTYLMITTICLNPKP
jgi:hypothetical protein